MLIDFDKGVEKPNTYRGSEKKTKLMYNDELYMIKYPDPIREGTRLEGLLSYKNNHFSEFIGSSIFAACGFKAQEVYLGYLTNAATQKKKLVVGCKDFTQDGSTLYEIAQLSNQAMIEHKWTGTSIENIPLIVEASTLNISPKEVTSSFWEMFVVDALIGNADRHFGNWGLMEKGNDVFFAPIYDCCSSLGALLFDHQMEEIIKNPGVFKNKEYNIASCYYMDTERIRYHEIFKNPPLPLAQAIKRILPRIDMDKITKIINDTPVMSDSRKQYLNKSLELRYTQILRPSLKKVLELEKLVYPELFQEAKPQKNTQPLKTEPQPKPRTR